MIKLLFPCLLVLFTQLSSPVFPLLPVSFVPDPFNVSPVDELLPAAEEGPAPVLIVEAEDDEACPGLNVLFPGFVYGCPAALAFDLGCP